jgi:hypothetical protein
MTPEERQLIAGLFDRMRNYSLSEKDGAAEALIGEQMRSVPDAAYMLVQSVLVQEQALQEAGNRIKALEDEVRALQGGQQERAPGPGGFLGGWFGNRAAPAPEPRTASVPIIGSRATPSTYDNRPPWTPPQGGPPQATPSPQAQAAPGGGFLRSAMATAAGVAGGMLAAGAIRDLFGTSAHATPANTTPATTTPPANTPPADTSPASDSAAAGASARSEPTHDAAHDDDDGGWFGDDGDWEI